MSAFWTVVIIAIAVLVFFTLAVKVIKQYEQGFCFVLAELWASGTPASL